MRVDCRHAQARVLGRAHPAACDLCSVPHTPAARSPPAARRILPRRVWDSETGTVHVWQWRGGQAVSARGGCIRSTPSEPHEPRAHEVHARPRRRTCGAPRAGDVRSGRTSASRPSSSARSRRRSSPSRAPTTTLVPFSVHHVPSSRRAARPRPRAPVQGRHPHIFCKRTQPRPSQSHCAASAPAATCRRLLSHPPCPHTPMRPCFPLLHRRQLVGARGERAQRGPPGDSAERGRVRVSRHIRPSCGQLARHARK
jgi:hypothetical protein